MIVWRKCAYWVRSPRHPGSQPGLRPFDVREQAVGTVGVGVLVVSGFVQNDEGGENRCSPGRLPTGGSGTERALQLVHRGERAVLIGVPGVTAGEL